MKNRAKFWLVLWIILISIGSIFSAVCAVWNYLKNGVLLQTFPYANYQIFLLLGFLPVCLIPVLCMSYYYAIKEKNKKIKIASMCFIIHHTICVIAVLLQIIGA